MPGRIPAGPERVPGTGAAAAAEEQASPAPREAPQSEGAITDGPTATAIPEPIPLTLPPDSGLELVETRHPAAPTVPEPEPARPKRVRPAREQVQEEPLQMVETRRGEQPPASS